MKIERLLFDAASSFRVLEAGTSRGVDELAGKALAVRAALLARGVSPGDRVLLICEGGAALLAGLAGITSADAAAVLVDAAAPVASLAGVIDCAQPSSVCWSGARAAKRAAHVSGQYQTVSTVAIDDLPAEGPAASRWNADADEPAVVFFSSGTTGKPKGIVLSHDAILSNVSTVAGYLSLTSDDSVYVAKSMVHSSTLVGELMQALHAGATLITPEPAASGADLVRRVAATRATFLGLNPSLLTFFTRPVVRERLSALRLVHVSGSIVDGPKVDALHASCPWIRIHNGYGLTEAGPRVAQTSSVAAIRQGSVGRPLPGVEVFVRGDTGAPCRSGEVGEIHVRSPSLLQGYLHDGTLSRPRLVDGALPTRDLGYVDGSGDLHVVGRVDDLIITASHNVNPQDVEDVIRSVPAVTDCVVFGVPDELLGERIVCLYTSDAGTARDGSLEREIRQRCVEMLMGYQIPQQLRWSAALPTLGAGKVSRRMARDAFLGAERA